MEHTRNNISSGMEQAKAQAKAQFSGYALDAVKTERSPTMADTIEATGCTLCELEGTLEAMARVLGEPGYPSCCEQEMPFDLPTRLDLIKGSASRCLELARRAQQRLS